MGRFAVRIGDMHACPAASPLPHAGGPIVAGFPRVLVCDRPAARLGDTAACVAAVDVITQGARTVLIGGLPGARLGDTMAHGGAIVQGCPTVQYGKVLFMRIVIVRGSVWDTPEGRARIAQHLREAERILDITIITGEWETVDDPSLLNIPAGNWTNGDNYSTGQTGAVDRFGAPDRPCAIYTNSSGDGAALAVSHGWEGNNDVGNEGILVGQGNDDDNVTAHELGHLLSNESGNNTHVNTDETNLMEPHASGDNWTDPYRSSAERSPYLN